MGTTTTGTGGGRPGRRRRSPVFVDRSEIKEVLDLKDNRAVARYVETGAIPPPVRWLTPRRPVWDRREWEAWLRQGRKDAGQPPPPASPVPEVPDIH